MCVWSIARASRSRNSFSTLPRKRVTATNSNGTAKTGTARPGKWAPSSCRWWRRKSAATGIFPSWWRPASSRFDWRLIDGFDITTDASGPVGAAGARGRLLAAKPVAARGRFQPGLLERRAPPATRRPDFAAAADAVVLFSRTVGHRPVGRRSSGASHVEPRNRRAPWSWCWMIPIPCWPAQTAPGHESPAHAGGGSPRKGIGTRQLLGPIRPSRQGAASAGRTAARGGASPPASNSVDL